MDLIGLYSIIHAYKYNNFFLKLQVKRSVRQKRYSWSVAKSLFVAAPQAATWSLKKTVRDHHFFYTTKSNSTNLIPFSVLYYSVV